jgi:hypothetical protein
VTGVTRFWPKRADRPDSRLSESLSGLQDLSRGMRQRRFEEVTKDLVRHFSRTAPGLMVNLPLPRCSDTAKEERIGGS